MNQIIILQSNISNLIACYNEELQYISLEQNSILSDGGKFSTGRITLSIYEVEALIDFYQIVICEGE